MQMTRNTLFCLAALIMLFCGSARAEQTWPGFRHDRMHTGRATVAGPISASPNWSYDMGGVGFSPVAADGMVYATGGGKVFCWTSKGTPSWTYGTGSASASTPCIGADGTVYVGSLSGYVCAINSNGSQRWKRNVGTAVDASPAIAADGTIYAGTRAGKLYVLKPDGTVKFIYSAGGAIASSPAIGTDGTVYFGCDDGKLYAVKSSGAAAWAFAVSPTAMLKSSPCIADDGTIYIGSMGGALYAIYPDGRQKFRYLANGVIYSSPAVAADGSVYFGARDGALYCLAKTGVLKWKLQTGASTDSSPSIDSLGTIYVGSSDGRVYAVKPDGSVAWSLDCGGAVACAPAIGEIQTLFVTTASGKLCSFGIDTTPPMVPIVLDEGIYSSSPDTLRASWSAADPESGIARYEYAIGTTPGATDVVAFTDAGTATQIARAGLPLVNGAVYYFSVRATNMCGLVSDIGISDGVEVDFTPPTTPYVIDDGDFTNMSSDLHFVYASGDTESGIEHYEYSVGTAPDLSDTLPWTGAGTVKEQTVTGLSLSHGKTYTVNVRAYNRAGLVSTGHSNGVLVDHTKPDVAIQAAASNSEIRATITAVDQESGAQSVQYVMLTTSDIPPTPEWRNAESGKEIVLPGTYDWRQSYYIAGRALNKAGSWSDPKLSAPIRMDTTPPSTPVVTDDGKYWTDTATLHATWTAQDADSGIKSNAYCVGRSAGTWDVVGWTDTTDDSIAISGLSLANGETYYFGVRATNGAGLVSGVGVSDGIMVDTTPPSVPTVTDDGDYTSSQDALHASWTTADAESGIVEYHYCLGTAPGKDDVSPWKSAGASTQASVTGLSLQMDTVYYFSVKARNGAGLQGEAGSNDGIEYRLGPPTWPRFRHDLQSTGCAPVKGPTSPQLKWRLQAQGYVESSGAVASDGRIYVGSSDGKLYSIMPSGTIAWAYQTGSCIDSSPAIGPTGCIYVGSYDGYLYCLYPTGTLRWRYAAGSMIWSSPAVTSDGTVYFGAEDGAVYALNADGTLKWRRMTGGALSSSPSVGADGSICIGSGDGRIYCLNADGGQRWSYQTGSAVISSPAIDTNGVIYCGSGDGFLYAITPVGTRKWRQYLGKIIDSSPAVTSDGNVYVGTGVVGSGGALYAFDKTGKQLWRIDLSAAVHSSPAVDLSGNVFIGCADGKILAVNPSGAILWQYKADQSILSSPALCLDGSIVLGTDSGGIYCIKNAATADTSPPTVPVVTLDHQLVTADTPVKVTWVASDPESGVQGYSYAIGSQFGGCDVLAWAEAPPAGTLTIGAPILVAGQSYYVSVVARNGVGLSSGVGCSNCLTVVSGTTERSIGTAKKRPEGTKVLIESAAVVGVYDDCVFVEDMSRCAGVRCVVQGSGVVPGSIVSVSGVMSTLHNEPIILSPVFQPVPVAGMIKPVSTRCDLNTGLGVDMTGLLVRLTGRITKIASNLTYMVISDGSYGMSPRGAAGVEVRMPVPSDLKPGSYIGVNGIVCGEVVNARLVTILRGAPDPRLTVYRAP